MPCPPSLAFLLVTVGAYMIGSIPFSLLIARWGGGIDLRQHGSGNIGATNVGRVLGARWGVLALAADLLKGFVSVAALPPLLADAGDPHGTHLRVAAGVAAVAGHMFPVWLGFRGGKGVATALGVVVSLAPAGSLIAFGLFVLSFALWRIVSLSSIIAVVGFAVAQAALYGRELLSPTQWSLGLFSVLVPALIVGRHRSNIVRLLRGEEKRLQLGRRQPASESSPDGTTDATPDDSLSPQLPTSQQEEN